MLNARDDGERIDGFDILRRRMWKVDGRGKGIYCLGSWEKKVTCVKAFDNEVSRVGGDFETWASTTYAGQLRSLLILKMS